MRTIPEFSNIGLSRNKLQNLCKWLNPVKAIKNLILYKEGDPCKYVYFVKSGELKICKKILLPKDDDEVDELVEDP